MKIKLKGINLHLYEYDTRKDLVKVVHENSKTVKEMSDIEGSITAHNFSFADTNAGVPIGNVIVEGKVTNKNIAKTTLRESFCITYDGEVSIGYPDDETYYSLQGSPRLLVSGTNVLAKSIIRDETASDIAHSKAVRVAIGIKNKYQFIIIHTIDSITLQQLIDIFVTLGIKDALNGDGGGSSYHYPFNSGWGRKLGTSLQMKEGKKKMEKGYTIIEDFIPKTTPNNRRSGLILKPTTITLHNVGNSKSTAKNERAWLTNPSNDRTASYHTVIDEKYAVECLPSNEVGWHAGDGSGSNSGNKTSFGIEICESGNYAKTIENAIDYTARKLIEFNLTPDKLKRHFDWSGKICPRLMYDNGSWATWLVFKAKVESKYKELKGVSTPLQDGIKILFEGKEVNVSNEVKNGSTWIPLRPALEGMGFNVAYDAKTKTANITKK